MDFREAYLSLYNHEVSPFIPIGHINMIQMDAVEHGVPCGMQGAAAADPFGVMWTEHGMGAIPVPGTTRLADITRYREEGVIPDRHRIDALDWESVLAPFRAHWKAENLTYCMVPASLFERLHHLMGMENALAALITEPEAVKAFNRDMLQYKKHLFKHIREFTGADVICQMDDYGAAGNMFMSPDMWREFYLEPLCDLVEYTHMLGMKYEHHSCGYITPIVGDMIDAGVDALNPVQAVNDLELLADRYGGKLLFCGGLDEQKISAPGASEDEIGDVVARAVSVLAPTGCYLPQMMAVGQPRELSDRIAAATLKALDKLGVAYRT